MRLQALPQYLRAAAYLVLKLQAFNNSSGVHIDPYFVIFLCDNNQRVYPVRGLLHFDYEACSQHSFQLLLEEPLQ